MAIFQLGYIIKQRREELGLTQEDLADGICSVPTLSRIENGERLPTQNHFEMLLQRLGYSSTMFNSLVDEKNFTLHELKFEIRQAYIANQLPMARELLVDFDHLINKDSNQVDKQFLMLYQTLLHQENFSNAETLAQLETAIRLTCPKYKENKIPHILSYEEIILLNIIATRYELEGNRNLAIQILFNLKAYYDRHIVNTEEALRTQPMVLYNLSKLLGLAGRYDECIDICNLGIRVAKSTGRCTALDRTLYNRAWALLMRGQDGDILAAKQSAIQAYQLAGILGYSKESSFYHVFIEKHFKD